MMGHGLSSSSSMVTQDLGELRWRPHGDGNTFRAGEVTA